MKSVMYSRRDLCRNDSVSLGIYQQHSCSSVEFLERLGNSQLLRTLGFSVLDRIGQGKVCSGLQPMHMKIHFIAWRCSF